MSQATKVCGLVGSVFIWLGINGKARSMKNMKFFRARLNRYQRRLAAASEQAAFLIHLRGMAWTFTQTRA